jgi:iron complex transport system ATP-binding protein
MVRIDGEELDRTPPVRRRQLLSFLPANRDVAWPISARDLIALGLDRPDSARIDARSLAAQPKVLLLDEPLSNLDPYWVLKILKLIRDCADEGAAVLLALHDLSLIGAFDRSLLVAHGRLQADDSPHAILQHPSFEEAFRVRRTGTRWSISPSADQRSSL